LVLVDRLPDANDPGAASGVHDPLDVLDVRLVLRRLVQAEY
jgi:hypothetical protein